MRTDRAESWGGSIRCRNPTRRPLAVPTESHRERELDDVNDLEPETKDELQKFFIATDEIEAKQLSYLDWASAKKARQLIKKSAAKFTKS